MEIQLNPAKKIIIAPLNWGLGHATRCIPIIRKALQLSKDIIIASDGLALDLLQKEFPNLKFHQLPSYNIDYTGSNFVTSMLRQVPKINRAIFQEHKVVKALVNDFEPDLIISDNRYGVYHNQINSVIITHQLQPYFNNVLISKPAHYFLNLKLKKFNEIWVPDFPSRNLSGILSKSKLSNTKFIGPLTRLDIDQDNELSTDLLIILSGPEPKRTILENKLFELVQQNNAVIIRGTNDVSNLALTQKFKKVYDLADSKILELEISKAKKIVCRSGYTSVMDLQSIPDRLLLIPTPGQPEQEYLAKHLKESLGIQWVSEEQLVSKNLM